MDKKVINEEQFRKLVIKEAKTIFSDEKSTTTEVSKAEGKKKFTFEAVENLINEIENMNTSIASINLNIKDDDERVVKESTEDRKGPNRDLDVNEHNRKKNFKHVNESEKDRWSRMLKYKVPKDEDR